MCVCVCVCVCVCTMTGQTAVTSNRDYKMMGKNYGN